MTQSGKSTLAKTLIKSYKARGIKCLVLDPIADPDWSRVGVDFSTDDGEKFLQVVFNSRKCAIFVDESGEAIGRYAGQMMVLGTRSRHYGHNAHFIAQRAVDLSKTIRDQCANLFCFRVSKKDAETLADEYANDALLGASLLQKGEFIKCGRFSPAVKLKVF